jgi:hypothetical protein
VAAPALAVVRRGEQPLDSRRIVASGLAA